MSQMIEKVAKAIKDARRDLIALPIVPPDRMYVELAKAAIEAMRETTDDMQEIQDRLRTLEARVVELEAEIARIKYLMDEAKN